jgi:hypothetical protein
VWADKQSLLSLEGRTCTFINWIVQALNCYMSGSQLGLVMYGLSPRLTNQRIAPKPDLCMALDDIKDHKIISKLLFNYIIKCL